MTKYKQILGYIDPNNTKTEFKPIFIGDTISIENFREKHNNQDIYLTPNYFNELATTHAQEYVALIKQLTIDFDLRLAVQDIELKKEVANYLKECSDNQKIPQIHKVISSGRGLYIVFMIDNETNLHAYSVLGEMLAKKIDKLIGNFNPLLHLDSQQKTMDYGTLQANRVFRIEGSINSKSGEVVETIYNSNREPYTFNELAETVSVSEKQKAFILSDFISFKQHKRPKHLPKHFTATSLYYARVGDLETIQSIRKLSGHHKGYRNQLLFYYGVALRVQMQDIKDLENAMREFNKDFKYPLKDSELKATIKSIIKTQYSAKNSSMIRDLNISLYEQRHLKTIIGYTVKRERKRDRNSKAYKNTKETNQSSLALRNALIVEMKQENSSITLQEIADFVGVSKMTVSRVLKKACL